MSRKYRLGGDHHAHFVTFTVIDWIDFFIRNEYKDVFLKALQHYQKYNGLGIYAYCIMTSHIHLILRSESAHDLSGAIKNLKGYTARTFHKLLTAEQL